jgi:hypothetical protein
MLHRERRLALGTAATMVAAGLLASPAHAAWGPVLTPAASGGAQRVTVAVDGRGDVAAAWVQEYGRTVTVRAAVAANGRPATVRTLLRARDRAVRGLATTLDRRGELTVAWVDQASTRGLVSAAGAPADGWAAVTADRAGDQFVAPARPALSGPPGVKTAPLGGPAYFATASAPDGAALAAARPTRRALRVAVWRPPAAPLSR